MNRRRLTADVVSIPATPVVNLVFGRSAKQAINADLTFVAKIELADIFLGETRWQSCHRNF